MTGRREQPTENPPDEEQVPVQTRKLLASFLPNVVLSELSLRLRSSISEDVMCPYSYTFRGACLMADISGFTRLSGAYCAKGKDGLDGLQHATSGYMGQLVQVVYLCGGDVIKFAGDALLCIFRPRPSLKVQEDNNQSRDDVCDSHTDYPFQVACASAVRCAWELKDLSTDALSLHVAVSCGTLCLGSLGGFENKWEFLVSGECIMSLSQCLDEAPSKNVVLTRDCYESVKSLLKSTALDGGVGSKEANEVIGTIGQWPQPESTALLSSLPDNRQVPLKGFEAEDTPSGNVRVTVCNYRRAPASEPPSVGSEPQPHSGHRETLGHHLITTSIDDVDDRMQQMYAEKGFNAYSPTGAAITSMNTSAPQGQQSADVKSTAIADQDIVESQQGQQRGHWSDNDIYSENKAAVSPGKGKEGSGKGAATGGHIDVCFSNELVTQASSYIPLPVTQALLSGSFNFLAELREVTTMFIKWDSYDYHEHRDLLSLQEYLYASQEILSETGGFLRQFLVDDKGCVFIGLWGVPTATYPDNCRRALWAAARIATKLKDMGMNTSIGITTGVVYCGTVGSSLRQEYAAVGDVVNLSARLMCKAKGGIMTDEPTYSRLPKNLKQKLKKLPKIMVKGKDAPITPYQYVTSKQDAKNSENEDRNAGDHSSDVKGLPAKRNEDNFDSNDDDDVEIRQVCKDAMTASLKKLLENSDGEKKDPGEEGDDETYVPITGNDVRIKDDRNVDVLIVEDKDGAGNEAAAEWLKRQCFANDLRVINIHLSSVDATVEYRGLAKLFRCLIREENFDNIRRQTLAVNCLLRDLYQDDWETITRVAYPTLRHALGVKCPLTDCNNDGGDHADGGISHENSQQAISAVGANNTDVHQPGDAENKPGDDGKTSVDVADDRSQARGNATVMMVAVASSGSVDGSAPNHIPSLTIDTDSGIGRSKSNHSHNRSGRALSTNLPLFLRSARALTSMTSVRNFLDTSQVPPPSADHGPSARFRVPPPRLMDHCIQYVFSFLLAEEPIVIVIDEAHHLDESSWNMLLTVVNLHARALFVLLQKPISQLEACAAKSATTAGTAVGPLGRIREESAQADEDAGVCYVWIDSYLQRLLRTGHAQRIELPDYTFAEARKYLLSRLKISEEKLPPDFDFFFYNMTGNGSLFWVREITAFIVTYGVEEFMKGVKRDTGGSESAKIQSSSPRSLGSRAFSGVIGFAPLRRKFSDARGSMRRAGTSANQLLGLSMKAKLDVSEKRPALSRGIGSRLTTTHRYGNGNGNGNGMQSVHVAPADMKLEFIIVCRFAKLSMEEQSIIRTASIAGVAFTMDILSAVVSERIRPYLAAILGSLVKQHWLTMKSATRTEGSHHDSVRLATVKYTFSHPLLQRTLYDLTPASVRATMHLSIATHIDDTHGNDRLYFPALAFHYCNAGTSSREKAFEYSVKAAREMVSSSYRCSVDEIIRLLYTATDLAVSNPNLVELLDLVGLCRTKAYEVYSRKNNRKPSFDSMSLSASRVYSQIQSGLHSITELLSPISSISHSPFITPRNSKSVVSVTIKPIKASVRIAQLSTRVPPGAPSAGMETQQVSVKRVAGRPLRPEDVVAIAMAATKKELAGELREQKTGPRSFFGRLISCKFGFRSSLMCDGAVSGASLSVGHSTSGNGTRRGSGGTGGSGSCSGNSGPSSVRRRSWQKVARGGSSSGTARRLFAVSSTRGKVAPDNTQETLVPTHQLARLNRLEQKLEKRREELFLYPDLGFGATDTATSSPGGHRAVGDGSGATPNCCSGVSTPRDGHIINNSRNIAIRNNNNSNRMRPSPLMNGETMMTSTPATKYKIGVASVSVSASAAASAGSERPSYRNK